MRVRTAHLYEDLLVIEPVDEAGRPVPAGTGGARMWVSVLSSRTLPLIRYEMSDRVALGGRGCPCGRSFRIVERVEGRTEDVLEMTAPAGTAPIYPNVFHDVLDSVAVSGWQVRHDGASALTVLLAVSAGDWHWGRWRRRPPPPSRPRALPVPTSRHRW